MRLIRKITVFISLLLSLQMYGQEENIWTFQNSPKTNENGQNTFRLYHLDFNLPYPAIRNISRTASYRFWGSSSNSSISGQDGNLNLFTTSDTAFTKGSKFAFRNTDKNQNGNRPSSFFSPWQSGDTLFAIIEEPIDKNNDSIYDGTGLRLKSFSYDGKQISNESFMNGRFDSKGIRKNVFLPGALLFGRNYPELNCQWLAIAYQDSLVLIKTNYDFTVNLIVPLPSNLLCNENAGVQFSNNGKKIAINTHWDIFNVETSTNGNRPSGNYIVWYDFNPISGKTSNKAELLYPEVNGYSDLKPLGRPDEPDYHYYFRGLAFSPNDSFLYTIQQDTKPDPDETSYIQIPLYGNLPVFKIRTNISQQIQADLKLGPDGKIYSCVTDKKTLDVINSPNYYGENMNLELDFLNLLQNEPLNSVNYLGKWPITYGNYKRVSFSAAPTCNGLEIQFANTSDTSHFTHYRFYLGNGDSVDIASNNSNQTVLYTYPQPGRYLAHLRAFNSAGGWVYTRDSITVTAPPVAKLTVQDTSGCQWLAFQYTDSSSVPQYKENFYTREWRFTNGSNTTTEQDTVRFGTNATAKVKTFTQDGSYQTKLKINNGYCTDSFVLNQNITILPAPQPGISLADTAGCSPFGIAFTSRYANVVDSVIWQLNGNQWHTTSAAASFTDTLRQPGNFVLSQTNYGPTGCVTSATKTINVLQGFEEGYSVLLHTATFSPSYADSVSLFWQPAPYAKQYSILLNQQEIAQLTDTSYTHVSPNLPAVYTIQAENTCGDKALSNPGKLIELSVSLTEDNSTAIITWTPYEQWQAGVDAYEVQRLENGVFSTLGTLNKASTFSDYNFAATSVAKQCYRIKAQQKNGNWHSYSNSVWVPLAPTVWVPSAFSPNSDGLNDVFNLVAQGATAIEYTIYNRWGELIYSGNNWDGQNAPQGVYAYTATITFATGNKTNLKGMVSLLR